MLPWPNLTTAEWEAKLKARKSVVYIDKFDPDQPRDDHGRWSEAGGGGAETSAGDSVAATMAQSPAGRVNWQRAIATYPATQRASIGGAGVDLMQASFDSPSGVKESLLAVSSTGERLGSTAPIVGDEVSVDVDDSFGDMLREQPPFTTVVMHTHPSSSPPSIADFETSINTRTNATVLGEDGTVYDLRFKREPVGYERLAMTTILADQLDRARGDAVRMTDRYVVSELGYEHTGGEFQRPGRRPLSRSELLTTHPQLDEIHHANYRKIATKKWQRFAKDHADTLTFRVTPGVAA